MNNEDRDEVTRALGLPVGGRKFAWSYLLCQIRELVKCEQDFILFKESQETDQMDALCFRFWVSEAARSPAAMANLIASCTTEEDYRAQIMPIVEAGRKAMQRHKESPTDSLAASQKTRKKK